MKSSAKNIVLKSVDDIFQTEENRADAQRERVQEIPLDQLKPFKNHPFKVRDDQRMLDTVDSIREYGVLVPAIARPDPEGGYELISGHRRKRGCEMAGLQTMPVIIRDLDDDAAVLVMVDSNRDNWRKTVFPKRKGGMSLEWTAERNPDIGQSRAGSSALCGRSSARLVNEFAHNT